MAILTNISGGNSSTGTTSGTSTALNVAVLPSLPTLVGVAVGGLGGAQVGSSSSGAGGANLLSGDINLLQGLSLGTGSGTASSTGTGLTATTPVAVVGVGAPASTSAGGAPSTGGTGGSIATVDLGVGATAGTGTSTGGTGTGGGGTGTGTSTGTGTGGSGTGGGGSASTTLPEAHTAFQNIFRVSAADVPANVSAQLDTLNQMVASGQITAKQAILQIVHAAAGSTAVAETTYQFFSGLTPTSAGLDYLVHSTANPSDLNDSYYASFNVENRYTNFAANLGLHSDYAPAFAAIYAPMTFDGAVRTAYDRIVGAAQATAAGINPEAAIANIEAQLPYFQQVAHERFGAENFDLSTKLAAIGYILEEAVKANVGNYGVADQNFLFDLADGQAQFHVDLVATYGKGTPLDVV